MTEAAPIRIHLAAQRAFVWDVDDIAALRSRHNICGILAGTLPQHSQQNIFLGAPLVLLPEEVVLLVDQGFAVLIDDPLAQTIASDSSLTVEQLHRWLQAQKLLSHKQLEINRQKEARLADIKGKKSSEEAARKRAEREAKRRQAIEAAASATIDVVAPDVPEPIEVQTEPSVQPISQQSTAITIPTSSSYEWYQPPPETIHTSIASAIAAGIWSYPSTQFERARCAVFRKLWEQGHFMGGGSKFGGEFLVYPGDPLRYHSHFAASVLESPEAPLRPMEIVAHGRLGTATKKAHLLCAWDEGTEEVEFVSIEWAGFG